MSVVGDNYIVLDILKRQMVLCKGDTFSSINFQRDGDFLLLDGIIGSTAAPEWNAVPPASYLIPKKEINNRPPCRQKH